LTYPLNDARVYVNKEIPMKKNGLELEIRINMDNASFDNYNVGEITRILKAYTETINKGGYLLQGDLETLVDSNGNKVGYARVN